MPAVPISYCDNQIFSTYFGRYGAVPASLESFERIYKKRKNSKERFEGMMREREIGIGERALFYCLGQSDLAGCGDSLDQEALQGFLRQGIDSITRVLWENSSILN